MNEHGLQFNGRSDEIKLILKNLATNGNGVGNGNTCLAIKLRLELEMINVILLVVKRMVN